MKKILVCVDNTKGSLPIVDTMARLFPCVKPDEIILLYVEKLEGLSMMDDLVTDTEIMELKEALKGTDYKELLDKKAQKIMDYFKKALEEKGITGIRPVIREGHPVEEILKIAEEEGVNMIVVGSRGKRLHNILLGSVSREIANRANVPVLIVK
ncbi:MAG TPA: universal stress protein [Nitrospirae bacterium]|nr:universal stress protein [Nitrospirota bacterium]